jgi:hypothetical protein
MALALLTLGFVILTFAVTWLLHLDSLEADWRPQPHDAVEAVENEQGMRTVLLDFTNIGRGAARKCTVRVDRGGDMVRAVCKTGHRSKDKVKPGRALPIEVTWSCSLAGGTVFLEIVCQTRSGRRLVHRFKTEIADSRLWIEAVAC